MTQGHCDQVTWIELALDFQCVTRVPLASDGESDDDYDIYHDNELDDEKRRPTGG